MHLLGIDPGLRHMGWGVVALPGAGQPANVAPRLVAAGVISPPASLPMAARLAALAAGLTAVVAAHQPISAAVEETFVNAHAKSALALGQARGIALLVPAQAGLEVAEYAATTIKKTITGYGHADKAQLQAVLRLTLAGYAAAADGLAPDAADALAIALTHAQFLGSAQRRLA